MSPKSPPSFPSLVLVYLGSLQDIFRISKLPIYSFPDSRMPFVVCENDNVTGELQLFTGPFEYDTVNEWITQRSLPVLAEVPRVLILLISCF
jgi:hypothetical protein